MLSYVEYYNPDYFLLENVRGLLNHTLQDGRTNTVVQAGMVKFICRTSLALGSVICDFYVDMISMICAPVTKFTTNCFKRLSMALHRVDLV